MIIKEDTSLEVTFQDGVVKHFDMAQLFGKYPQLRRLSDRQLFEKGRLVGFYGIVWDDDLDIDTETIYEEGTTVRKTALLPGIAAGEAVLAARAEKAITQRRLAEITGIDQSDISRIERGMANPTVGTLEKIAAALGMELKISIE